MSAQKPLALDFCKLRHFPDWEWPQLGTGLVRWSDLFAPIGPWHARPFQTDRTNRCLNFLSDRLKRLSTFRAASTEASLWRLAPFK